MRVESKGGGLSLHIKLGDSVELEVEGKKVRITVYETKRGSARLTFKADPDIQITRIKSVKKDTH